MAINIDEEKKSDYMNALSGLNKAIKAAYDYSGSDTESMRTRNRAIERAYEEYESARKSYLNI